MNVVVAVAVVAALVVVVVLLFLAAVVVVVQCGHWLRKCFVGLETNLGDRVCDNGEAQTSSLECHWDE